MSISLHVTRHGTVRFDMDKYETLPHQLELSLEGIKDWCPRCNPECVKDGGPPAILRSLCGKHWRELEASFDHEAFDKSMKEILEDNQRLREPQHGVRFEGFDRWIGSI